MALASLVACSGCCPVWPHACVVSFPNGMKEEVDLCQEVGGFACAAEETVGTECDGELHIASTCEDLGYTEDCGMGFLGQPGRCF